MSTDLKSIQLKSDNFNSVVEKLAQNKGVYSAVDFHCDRVYMEIDESEKKPMDNIFGHPYLVFKKMVFQDSFFDEHN